ncbi:MAG TPA: serine--tRNA ligase [Candidatus Paceibacterota bacterium]
MLDINLIRKNPEVVKKSLKDRNMDPCLADDFLVLDNDWRELIKKIDESRATLNKLSKERNVAEATKVKAAVKALEGEIKGIEEKREELLYQFPNIPAADVPVGASEKDNVVLREVGKKPNFNFKPKDHLELGKNLDILDFEAGSKVSGAGFYYLKNEGALLEVALVGYALDFLKSKGFVPVITPDLARQKFYLGTGYLPRGPEAQTYEIKDSDLGLIATSEVTLAGIHADEILHESVLPARYAGYSHCFRQESGGYGKYSKGLYRVHQFTKVEMFVYAKPEDSDRIHNELLELEEKLWQGLKIPYRVLKMCTADLGAQAARKFDLEAWLPGRGDWGEVTSASNTTDYQARRLGIKFKRDSGESDFVHTLNGTAIATSRAIVAILENFQTEKGAVKIPTVLAKYAGFKEIKR